MKFEAIGNEIFLTRKNTPKERTLVVVGGSAFLQGLAAEIAAVLNDHYNKPK